MINELEVPKAFNATWALTGSIERDTTPQAVEVSKARFQIGRRPDLDLSLTSRVVSSLHAELIHNAGMLVLRDLNSTNGTYVNGNRITRDTVLSEGDWIEIGDIHLRVDLVKTEDAPQRDRFLKTRLFNLKGEQEAQKGLHELIATRALGPCFQPIHVLEDRDIHGYEFLARSTVKGVDNPGKMFAAAEAAGREIELSMLCREVGVDHSICLPAKLPLFLNTHPHEPMLKSVVPQMRKLRDRVPRRPLVLEIHEGAIMEPGLVRELRAALSEFDVQLAFDDFGAGQARIRELICAPSDYIKFDAALIRDLQEVSGEQLQLFRSIIRGVKEEGAITVAEGVETEEMVDVCAEVGFDLVQGYAMSRPAIMYPALPDNPNDTATLP
ncbi:MAG: EAL domain-containing protein [Planctomycetaceae bacterium]|nr:EAL domain-containing protein [Planctomycetaceae bacterium]